MSKVSKNELFLVSVTVFLIAVLFTVVSKNRPIADDYNYLSIEFAKNPIAAVSAFHYVGSGRYAQAFDQATFVRLFDTNAIIIYPVFLFLLLTFSIFFIMKDILVLNKTFDKKSLTNLFIGSFLTTTLFFCAIPYFIDSVLWFSSATVHLAGVVYAIFAIALVLNWLTSDRKKRNHRTKSSVYGLMFLFGTFHFTHSEAVNLMLIVYTVVGLTLFTFRGIRSHRSSLRQLLANRKVQSLLILAFMAGIPLVVMYFSPAVRARSSLGMGAKNVSEIITNGFRWNAIVIKRTIFNWAGLLASSLLGVGLYLIIGDRVQKVNMRRGLKCLTIIGVSGFLAGLAVAMLDVYAVNGINYRMVLIPMSNYFAATALAVLVILKVLSGIYHFEDKPRLILFVLATPLIILLFSRFSELDQVVTLRASIFDHRERHLLSIGSADDKYYVDPAPYLYDTEAEDLFYSNRQYEWMMPSIAQYYHLNKKSLILNSVQPELYCSDNYQSEFKGIKNCSQLGHR